MGAARSLHPLVSAMAARAQAGLWQVPKGHAQPSDARGGLAGWHLPERCSGTYWDA
ncbi:hypothetical protein [Dinoroseobacter sp. S375]|uniref:hypothetical protein n=1 Tax=Dinoroseobacter sp. S375 TaxID=3415136 RepID=UPI003C7E2A58